MSQSRGLQRFIEQQAAGPAFAIAAGCTIVRGAVFWSGGALDLHALLGTRGLQALNGVTGIGIAVGAELLASIFGRQWLRYSSEEHEIEGRPGMRRSERAAAIKDARFRGRLSFAFGVFGLCASTAAGFAFLHAATSASSVLVGIGEFVITLALVGIIAALGVFYEPKPDDVSEHAIEQARSVRSRVVVAAGGRLEQGTYSVADIQLVARQLPQREHERFIAAFAKETKEEPLWTVTSLADWLGCDTPAGRRALYRRLAKLIDAGEPVTRDGRGAYQIPQSIVVSEFAGDFIALNSLSPTTTSLSSIPRVVRVKAGDTRPRLTRQLAPLEPSNSPRDIDTDTRVTHDLDTRDMVGVSLV